MKKINVSRQNLKKTGTSSHIHQKKRRQCLQLQREEVWKKVQVQKYDQLHIFTKIEKV